MITISHINDHFNHLNSKLLVSCPKDPHREGGLFVLDFSLNNISKILNADCRGIAHNSDYYYVATNSHGILKLNKELNIISTYDVPSLDLHGLKMDSDGFLYAVETKTNSIGIYRTEPFERIDEIKISPSDEDQNHINDIWIDGNSLYVSMFSLKGGWRQMEGSYDGVIAEYSLKDKSLLNIVQPNLQLPHSILKINDNIYVCESFNMNLMENSRLLAQFNGFTRGLAYDGKHFFVGQSQMRHLDKILSKHSNVSLDCGIHIFDSVEKSNRFIHFPANQIYEILIINNQVTTEKTITIDFSNPESDQFLNPKEWHGPEPTHRWMKSKKASIKLQSNLPVDKLVIEAYNGFPGEYTTSVFLNGILVGQIEFSGTEFKTFEFSFASFQGNLDLLLTADKTWCPSEIINNDDTRELGLAFKKIIIS